MSAPPPPEGASPSSQLEATFQASSDFVRALPKDAKEATQAEKLRAYGFYKQATEGDATGSRPGMMNFVRHVDQQLDTNSRITAAIAAIEFGGGRDAVGHVLQYTWAL